MAGLRQLSLSLLLAMGLARGLPEYQLAKAYVGPDFFNDDDWEWWNGPDPTNGAVRYVDKDTASSAGMINATQGRVYVGPDLENVRAGEGIPSVRIQSKKLFNSGLFVVSVEHQPTGCGVWPAFWMDGTDGSHPWPTRGEADLIEGAHGQTRVFTTLHTDASCDQSSVKSGEDFSGSWNPGKFGNPASNCSIHAVDQSKNQGCSQEGPADTMGAGFNLKGGGTFAFEWDPVAGYFRAFAWDMGEEPEDLKSGQPRPSTWGLPYSMFRLTDSTCPASYFQSLRMILNTDFCGDWGEVPEDSFHTACPHVPTSMTCPEYVSLHAKNLTEAYWMLKRLDVYQKSKNRDTRIVI